MIEILILLDVLPRLRSTETVKLLVHTKAAPFMLSLLITSSTPLPQITLSIHVSLTCVY